MENDTFNLTPEEQRVLLEATPEQWAETVSELAKDPAFWTDLVASVLAGFLDGVARGFNLD